MIRVLHVVTHMNRGGLETMIMNYYRHMNREQVQFDFLTHRPYDGDYGEEIHSLGGVIYHLPVLNPFSKNYRAELDQFFQLHPEYQIVHVHQDCMSSVILKAAKKNGVKVRIAHSHSSSQDKNIKYPIKLYFRHGITKYATDLFACGQDAGVWMFCGAQFKILRNAIDAESYSYSISTRQRSRRELNLSDDTFVVGHVGRFSPPKNHQFILDVFRQIHKDRPDSVLILVGDNKNEIGKKIAKQIHDYELDHAVIMTGLRTDVASLMQSMDVFLFPSLYEGVPVTMVEAQAAGLPCIISDRVPTECGITNLVTQVHLNDSIFEWAQQIEAHREDIRRNMYDEICAAGFDIRTNAEDLQQMYEQLANED